MPFQKGQSRPAGAGRKPGTPNGSTAKLREQIIRALNAQPGGGVEYLKRLAVDEPRAFTTLLCKVLPTQVGGDPEGVPIMVSKIEFVAMPEDGSDPA